MITTFNEAEALAPRNIAHVNALKLKRQLPSMRPRRSRLGILTTKTMESKTMNPFNEAEALAPRNMKEPERYQADADGLQ